jgi:hypothetical protein
VLACILDGLADEAEGVRDAALAAGRVAVELYAQAALPLLLPAVEAGIISGNWRIRQSSVELLGDLLFKVGSSLRGAEAALLLLSRKWGGMAMDERGVGGANRGRAGQAVRCMAGSSSAAGGSWGWRWGAARLAAACLKRRVALWDPSPPAACVLPLPGHPSHPARRPCPPPQVAGTTGRIQQDLHNEEEEGISVEAHGKAITDALGVDK